MNTIEIRTLAAGDGVEWIGRSWDMFKQAPGVWIGILVVYLLIMAAVGMIPVASLAMNLFAPVFTAGICLGCRSLEQGQGLRLTHLFAAFQTDRLGPLVVVGAISLVGVVVIGVVGALIVGGGVVVAANAGADAASAGPGIVLAVLLIAALVVPLAMALWFAAPLVALDNVAPIESIKLSFRACWANLLPLLVWSLLALVLMIAAAIPLLLGWLVALPMLMAGYYCMYRDIFVTART